MVTKVTRLITILFILSIILSGTSTAGPMKAGPMKLTFSSASIGGNMHIIMGALGRLIEENVPGSNITVQPGGSGSNPIVVGSGQIPIGTTMYSNATSARDGRFPYKKTEKDVVALANLNIKQWITFVTTRLNYKNLKDLVDNKVPIKLVVGKAGTTSETLIRLILKEYKYTYDDIRKNGGSVTHVSHADAVNLMKDGHADVYASIPSARFPVMVDLTTSRKVNHLDLDRGIIDKIAKEYKLITGTLPANTYKNQTRDLYTLRETQLIIANIKKLSNEEAYTITKLLIENRQKMTNAHADMANFDPKIAPMNTGFPLHPGAEKYYKEAGLLK